MTTWEYGQDWPSIVWSGNGGAGVWGGSFLSIRPPRRFIFVFACMEDLLWCDAILAGQGGVL